MKMHWSYKSKYGKLNHPTRPRSKFVNALEWIHIVEQQEWLQKGLIDKIVYTLDEYNEMVKKIKEPK